MRRSRERSTCNSSLRSIVAPCVEQPGCRVNPQTSRERSAGAENFSSRSIECVVPVFSSLDTRREEVPSWNQRVDSAISLRALRANTCAIRLLVIEKNAKAIADLMTDVILKSRNCGDSSRSSKGGKEAEDETN